ncbi:hypothetical protein L1D52_24030 [Vibrio brasiliensis]|uniref:contractile injection system protein, VgrG/Pvc8 family n=1 Tax=Vibrio brasiliensis TaxID=170652 RepID=UPI001EFD6681|nr:contractile injection system protein, VgrG/Pvc8 family [Vibrio brasiliensis]MCG9785381.1 hypothetical protein [Vibrio brasiliensis]
MIITIAGHKGDELQSALITWSISDKSGTVSDRASLTLNSDQLSFLPASGQEYSLSVEGEGRGKWQVSTITEEFEPDRIVLQLSPAKFNTKDPTGWREPRKRSFPPATVGDVVHAVMSPHGYTVRVDPELASVKTEHLNQSEETDSAFITRLARRYDANAKPINNLFVFGRKGSLNKLSGNAKPVVEITRKDLKRGATKMQHATHIKFKGAKASYRVTETGENAEVTIGEAPFTFVKELFTSEAEARSNASARLQELTRNGQTFSTTIHGKRGLWAESVLTVSGLSARTKGNWSIDDVTLSGSRTKYDIQITASRPRG